MPIVHLPTDAELSEDAKHLFHTKVKPYIQVPVMGGYTRSLSYKPKVLANMGDEHLHLMPTRALPRKTKELIATGISMVNACSYCIVTHAGVVRAFFHGDDEELVELTALTAHFSALSVLETAYEAVDDVGPPPAAAQATLQAIEATLGSVPRVYRFMAHDPTYLRITWERERALLDEGRLDRLTKEMIALAVAARHGGQELFRLHWAAAQRHGATSPQLFEALHVMHSFQKNNVYTTGIQIKEPPPEWWHELQQIQATAAR